MRIPNARRGRPRATRRVRAAKKTKVVRAVTSSPGGAYKSQTWPSQWAGNVERTSVEFRFGPMGLPDRRHRSLQCARGVEVSHPACLLSADDRECRSARRELAG